LNAKQIASLPKSDIVWLASHRCSHGHTYLSHYECYKKEVLGGQADRIGFFDIESSGLEANFAIMFSYAILDEQGEVHGRTVTQDEVKSGVWDYQLCKELVDDFRKFDKIIGYYIKDRRFDLPFVRSRCMHHGIDFPKYGELKIQDLYDSVKNKMKLRRSGLVNACEFLGIKSKGHPLDFNVWLKAWQGDPKTLNYIWTHNVEDVESTRDLYNRVKDYTRKSNTSI